jgi:hypothetical protein
MVLRPAVLADLEIRYSSAPHGVEETRPAQVLVPLEEGAVPFSMDRAVVIDLPRNLLGSEPVGGASFAPLPAEGAQARSYDQWGKEIVRWIPNALPITLFESRVHKVVSQVNESERDFRARLALLAREARDEQADRLKQKYESRFRTLEERIRRAEQAVEKRSAQSQQALLDTGISVLGSVLAAATGGKGRRRGGILGAFLGGRGSGSGRAVRSAGRMARSRQDVSHAEETVEAAQEQLAALEQEFEEELKKIEVAADAEEALDQVIIRPRLNAISLRTTALAWTPWGMDASGTPVPLWK